MVDRPAGRAAARRLPARPVPGGLVEPAPGRRAARGCPGADAGSHLPRGRQRLAGRPDRRAAPRPAHRPGRGAAHRHDHAAARPRRRRPDRARERAPRLLRLHPRARQEQDQRGVRVRRAAAAGAHRRAGDRAARRQLRRDRAGRLRAAGRRRRRHRRVREARPQGPEGAHRREGRLPDLRRAPPPWATPAPGTPTHAATSAGSSASARSSPRSPARRSRPRSSPCRGGRSRPRPPGPGR